MHYWKILNQIRETHKSKGKDSGGNKCDGDTAHPFGHFHQIEMLADTGKDHEGKPKPNGVRHGINDSFHQVKIFLDGED